MAIQSVVHSNAFNFVSFIQNGVDPRTGQYTLGIELPELIGNNLSGPRLPLRLAFSPMNDQDAGFGIGWSFNLSQFAINSRILSLASGESFKATNDGPGQALAFAERKLDSFHFHNESDSAKGLVRYRVAHKSGLVEVLEPQPGNATLALPVRVLAPSGHGLTLAYERRANQTRLVSVTDDTGRQLLAIDHTSNSEVLIDLHPGQPATARYTLKRQGDELRAVVLPSDEQPSWRFEYQRLETVRCVSRVDTPLGGTERIYHLARGHRFPPDIDGKERWLPYVQRHVVQPGAGQPEMVTRYRFGTQNFLGYGSGIAWSDDGLDNLYKFAGSTYTYDSTAEYIRPGEDGEPEDVVVRTITRSFNRFHLLTEQVTLQGDSIIKVETEYHEVANQRFEHQPNKFQLAKLQTNSWSLKSTPSAYRERKVATDYDDFGNLTDETQANGIRTLSNYYPPDREGFVSQLRSRRVYPATLAEPGAQVLRTDYTYRQLEPLDALARGELLLARETLVREADNLTLHDTHVSYHENVNAPLLLGRRMREQREMNQLTTQVDYSYSLYDDATHPALQTVETITGFDHGLKDDQWCAVDPRLCVRHAQKTITLLHSVLIGEPLLNRDDNDVEIAYEYDRLNRVILETVAPHDPKYKAARAYTYQLTSAGGQQAVQTRVDVKGVTTWTYVDGLGREVREERQDIDFGLTEKARLSPRLSYTVRYDYLGDRVEETEYDWFERSDRALVTRFEYDDWGQQCCVTGPDGVRNHERHAMTGTAQWRDGPEVTQWRESADGKLRTGTTVTRTNAFDEPAEVERVDSAGKRYSLQRHFYDGLGRVAREIDARGMLVRFNRDEFDRLVDHTLADGARVHRDYALHSREDLPTSISVIHPNGSTESVLGEQAFDGLERMVRSITGGRQRLMAYEPGQRQPNHVVTPSKQHIEYEYVPALGEEPVARRLPGSHIKARYDYDPQNAWLDLCREEEDVPGRAPDPEQVQELGRTYYSTGELRSETRMQGTEPFEMKYVHSLRGRLLNYTDVLKQEQSYDYDEAGRLIFTALGTTSSTFAYDPLGRMRQIDTRDVAGDVPNRLITELEYDEFERETLRRFIFTGGDQQELRQEYNVVDGITRKELTGLAANAVHSEVLREEKFEYDARARLDYYESIGPLSPQDPSGVTIEAQEFYLDALDNIEEVRTWHADGRIDALYQFDNPDDPAQLTGVQTITLLKLRPDEAAQGADEKIVWQRRLGVGKANEPDATGWLREKTRQETPLLYDLDGNMTRDEAGRTLGYDALGRLVSVLLPGRADAATYGYDPLDRLASQTGEHALAKPV